MLERLTKAATTSLSFATYAFSWLCLVCLLDVINKNAVTDTCRVARLGHLKRDELAVVAYDRVGRFVAGIIAEVREPLVIAAAVELELPEVHIARAFLRHEVDASHVRALITIGAEREFFLIGRTKILGLHGATER